MNDSSDSNRADSADSHTISGSLLERVKDGQPEAWSRLVSMYGPLVYSWCRQSGLQAADAADIVQEVFGEVADHVAEFRREGPDHSFRGWLWIITRNKIRDHFRKHSAELKTIGEADLDEQLSQVPQREPDDQQSNTAAAGLVHRALEAIRPEFQDTSWEAFWRMTIQGQNSAEVAAELGMTKSAVRQAKYRVLRRLRQELQ